jgi:hypothetical protein
LERLEEPRDLVRWYKGSGVGHFERGPTVSLLYYELHGPIGNVVAERVLEGEVGSPWV